MKVYMRNCDWRRRQGVVSPEEEKPEAPLSKSLRSFEEIYSDVSYVVAG